MNPYASSLNMFHLGKEKLNDVKSFNKKSEPNKMELFIYEAFGFKLKYWYWL